MTNKEQKSLLDKAEALGLKILESATTQEEKDGMFLILNQIKTDLLNIDVDLTSCQ